MGLGCVNVFRPKKLKEWKKVRSQGVFPEFSLQSLDNFLPTHTKNEPTLLKNEKKIDLEIYLLHFSEVRYSSL